MSVYVLDGEETTDPAVAARWFEAQGLEVPPYIRRRMKGDVPPDPVEVPAEDVGENEED